MTVVTASIVLFKTPEFLISRIIDCVIKSNACHKLFVIDNSPEPTAFDFKKYSIIRYIKSQNKGYGAGHNIAMRESARYADFHVVLNPDVIFDEFVLSKMLQTMRSDIDIGLMMPNVIYPNGNVQRLCKLIPTPKDLFLRRFPMPFFRRYINKCNEYYELQFTGYKSTMNVPILSGCFMLIRISALKVVGLFDERFFMYAEDVDFSRRMHASYKTLFYPNATIIHDHAKDSFKNNKMLLFHVISVIRYFNKWGWLFDKERKKINYKFLSTENWR